MTALRVSSSRSRATSSSPTPRSSSSCGVRAAVLPARQVRHPADQPGDDARGRTRSARSSPSSRRPSRRPSAAEEEFKAQIADARKEAARIREEAREQGAQIIAEMREQAQAEAARIMEHGHSPDRGRAPAGRDLAARRGRHPGHLARRADRRRVPRGRRAQRSGRRPLPRRPRDARDVEGRAHAGRGRPDAARSLCRGARRAGQQVGSTRTLEDCARPSAPAVRRRRRRAPRGGAAPRR